MSNTPALSATRPLKKILPYLAAALLIYCVMKGFAGLNGVLSVNMMEKTGLTYGTVSAVLFAGDMVGTFAEPLFGYLGIKISNFRVLIAGALLSAAGYFGTAVCSDFAGLVLFYGLLTGLGFGALSYSVIFGAAIPLIGERHGAMFGGLLVGGEGLLALISAPLVESVSEYADIGFYFMIVAAVSLCMIPLAFVFRKSKAFTPAAAATPSEKRKYTIRSIYKPLLSNPVTYLIIPGFMYVGFIEGDVANHGFMELLLSGFGEFDASFVVMATCALIIASSLLAGYICSKAKNKYAIAGTVILSVSIFSLLMQYFGPSAVTTALFLCLIAFAIGTGFPLFSSIVQDSVPLIAFPAVFGLISIPYMLGYCFNEIIAGMVYDCFGHFIYYDLLMAGIGLVIGAVYLIYAVKKKEIEVRLL